MSIAVNATSVLWVDPTGSVFRVNKDGTGLTHIGTGGAPAGAMVADDDAAYVIEQGPRGSLHRFTLR